MAEVFTVLVQRDVLRDTAATFQHDGWIVGPDWIAHNPTPTAAVEQFLKSGCWMPAPPPIPGHPGPFNEVREAR